MSTFCRRFLLGLGLLALAGGCNPLTGLLILTGEEKKLPAEYHKLADKDKKKEVKVVLLTDMPLETRTEFIHADKEITHLFAQQLQKLTKDNGEKILIVNPNKVEEYKNSNPDWKINHVDLESVGKHFKADYVIHLDVQGLSMFQPGSNNTFYRGQADLNLTLINVKNPDELQPSPRNLTFTYPPEAQGGNLSVDADTPPHLFKQKFLNALARYLSWHFTDRPTRDSYMPN